jgi:hypothetical protein
MWILRLRQAHPLRGVQIRTLPPVWQGVVVAALALCCFSVVILSVGAVSVPLSGPLVEFLLPRAE